MTESGAVHYGTSIIEYKVVRSPRRKKTIEITLDAADGVIVAAPLQATVEQIETLLRKRASWVVQRSVDGIAAPRPKLFVSGETLPYMGREVRLEVAKADVPDVRLRFSHWAFMVTVPSTLTAEIRHTAVRSAFVRWYRRRARERITRAIAQWAPVTDTQPRAVTIRDQRQRWGSCGPDGTLRFNWRIAMADSWLLEYVVVHELCHLRHRGHSREFWAAVEAVMPDFKFRRLALKEVGASLSI